MWRVGKSLTTVFRGNEPAAYCETPEIAAAIVAAMNAVESTITEGLYTGARKRMPQPSAAKAVCEKCCRSCRQEGIPCPECPDCGRAPRKAVWCGFCGGDHSRDVCRENE